MARILALVTFVYVDGHHHRTPEVIRRKIYTGTLENDEIELHVMGDDRTIYAVEKVLRDIEVNRIRTEI